MPSNANVYEIKTSPRSVDISIELSEWGRGETIEIRMAKKYQSDELFITSIHYRKDCHWIIYQNAPEDRPNDMTNEWLKYNYVGWDDLKWEDFKDRVTLDLKKDRSLKYATTLGWTLEHWRLTEKAFAYAITINTNIGGILK